MRMITKMLAGAAGLAAFAAVPAAAQYYPSGTYSPYANGYSSYNPYSNGYNAYGYNQTYGNGYNSYNGYNAYAMNTNATQQCTAAVQNRLYSRTSLGQILGSLVGLPTTSAGRVVAITDQRPTRMGMRIRGIASSGRYAYNNYSPYGVGAYGALGYGTNAAADLSFRCDVDSRGYVRNVDIRRR